MEEHPRRRRRPALACQICRRRKIKCDQNDPCSHCVRHKVQCVYTLYADSNGNKHRAANLSERPTQAFQEATQSRTVPNSSGGQLTTAETGVGLSQEEAPAQQPTPFGTGSAYSLSRPDIQHSHAEGAEVNLGRSRMTETTPVVRVHSSLVPQPPNGQNNGQVVPPLVNNVHGSGSNEDFRVAELLERIRRLEESSTSRAEAGSADWLLQLALDKSRDLGKSRSGWMGKPKEFHFMIDCYSEMIGKDSGNASYKAAETASLVAQSGELVKKCKDTAKSIKLGRPSRSQMSSLEVRLPPRDVSDAMVDLYFESFESTHRILHGPTFRTEYQRYWDHPNGEPAELRLKILLVIGLGSSVYDHKSTDDALNNADPVHQWIYAAQSWLSGPLEKDRLSISGLQIYCLTILARQIFSVGGDLVWISTGSLVQTAMQMGLHRDPKYLPGVSLLQTELRRRLWATVLELVVQSSLDSWMPPRISLDEFNVEPPSNLNDEDLDESITTIEPHPKGIFTGTSMQLALLDSLPVRLRIVQLLNNLHSEPTYPRVLELSLALTKALQACASMTKQTTEDCTPFRRNLLDYLVRRFALPLHMSFSSRSGAEPTYRHSRQASLDAALAIISPEPDARFARLMAMGGGMFREGQRCALTAVGLELMAHTEAQRLDGTLGRAGAYRDMLRGAVRDLLSLSEERIRLGETNVKSHMFLGMILAQVEAVEAGLPVELEVARSARDSLQLCYGILSARARNNPVALASPAVSGSLAAGIDDYQGSGSNNMFGMGMDFDWDSIMSDVGFA